MFTYGIVVNNDYDPTEIQTIDYGLTATTVRTDVVTASTRFKSDPLTPVKFIANRSAVFVYGSLAMYEVWLLNDETFTLKTFY